MSTPEERYELAEQVVETLGQLTKDFKAIGMYTEVEHKALSSLLLSAGISMNILNPDRYTQYLDKVNSEYGKKKGIASSIPPEAATGQYL